MPLAELEAHEAAAARGLEAMRAALRERIARAAAVTQAWAVHWKGNHGDWVSAAGTPAFVTRIWRVSRMTSPAAMTG